ncbi:MAG TPA: hypothetical protein VFO01_13165 [Trebonia sp.]|nr:hypothetical protein [Trebonia sp.]
MRRRAIPLVGSALFVLIGMFTTTWGPTHLMGRSEWALPYDLWGTLIATVRLSHGNIGGIYAPGTGLISLPGAAVILLPCAALIDALGLSLQIPGPHNLHPAVWLVAGPYQMALSCVTLFAVDALAERLGVPPWKRALLQVASLGILWSPSARWGHPEDAFALALLLFAVLAQSNSCPPGGRPPGPPGVRLCGPDRKNRDRIRPARPDGIAAAGWLTGCAVCVQPLVLLALPVQLALLPGRRMIPFLLRGAAPSAVLLAAAAIANWHDTYLSVTSQPDSPVINHPTVWTSLAPQLAGQNVAAGPFRLATIAVACLCAIALRRHWQTRLSEPPDHEMPEVSGGPGAAGAARWPASLLAEVLWWVALTLALRSFFEPVMVSYYPWPPMAVALIPAATMGWRRLWAAGLLAGGLTGAAQGPSHAVWIWWVPIVAGLVILLALSRPKAAIRPMPLIRESVTTSGV